jgi:hypothetical protein
LALLFVWGGIAFLSCGDAPGPIRRANGGGGAVSLLSLSAYCSPGPLLQRRCATRMRRAINNSPQPWCSNKILCGRRCGFEADSLDECVKVVDDAVVEAIELRALLIRDGADGAEETRRERGVDSFE